MLNHLRARSNSLLALVQPYRAVYPELGANFGPWKGAQLTGGAGSFFSSPAPPQFSAYAQHTFLFFSIPISAYVVVKEAAL